MRISSPARVLAAGLLFSPFSLVGQSSGAAGLKTGKDIYDAGCAGCHGKSGEGAPQSTAGFERPRTFPDFTKCDQTTPEDDWAWKSVIRDGGPSRGFSTIMPSFSEALTSAQIDAVVKYMRGFCSEKGWPRGELNLPLAIGTEKAYPEDEVVVKTTINAHGAPGLTSEIVHEQRFGERNQIEVSVPVSFEHPERGLWYGGFGDVGIGLKRVLLANLKSGSILSVQGEAIFPTGNRAHGLGSGVLTFETFAAYGQMLPFRSFFQFQGGADLPVDTKKAPQNVFARGALGKSFSQDRGLGRMWSPMFETLVSRDLMTGAPTDIDVMPEFQVTLSKRQHIRFDVGYRIPVNHTSDRPKQVMFYLLWDWQDGRLSEGWK